MKIHEIIMEEQLNELNWRKGLATAALAAGTLGSIGSAQARVSPQADGSMSPSFAQQMAQQGHQDSAERPSGGTIDRTQGVTVDRANDTLEYNGKTYNIIRLSKNGPQPRIARFDAKINVPMADLGYRGIGSLPATLSGGNAYVYLP